MTCICIKCGFNIEREQPIDDGLFRYDPLAPEFLVSDVPLRCSPQIRTLLGSVMLARGRTLSYGVIADRLGYEGFDARNLVNVLTYRSKKLIEALGHAVPLERVHGLGLRWCRNIVETPLLPGFRNAPVLT